MNVYINFHTTNLSLLIFLMSTTVLIDTETGLQKEPISFNN